MAATDNTISAEHPHTLAYAGLVLTALFWAGNAVLARGVVDVIPPVALSFWRWALALLIVLPVGIGPLRRDWPVVRRNWRRMLLVAGLSVGLFNTLLYLAADSTTALNLTLINATMPILVALLAWPVLGARPRPAQAGGIACALAGIVTIVAGGRLAALLALSFRPGDLIMVGAVSAWALFSVLLRRRPLPMSAAGFLTAQILFGLPLILPAYLLELALVGGFDLTPALTLPFVYVAVFPGLLAYAFWNHGVARVGPSRAAMFIYLVPVFAAGLAFLLLGESLAAYHAVGGALILAGLYLATRVPTND
ncbi:DMT family transporter [Arhodomonas sp. AD133]|uniref:DMT family transporter n=1 Tax=Arhodomonas sp. AD133 TaxID=3415009 RepID=UPI003EBAD10F